MTPPPSKTTYEPVASGAYPAPDAYRRAAWLILGLALGLRLLLLGMKPPHWDEGVNGFFIDQMTRTGFYSYDPANYHGPFHFYVLFLAQTLFGRDIFALRLPLVLINVATVWMMLQYRRFLPWRVCTIAALAFAFSPGMIFYSRYAIHEAWLVFAMVLGFWGVAELWTRGTARGLWAGIMGVALMILTKETYLLHLLAFALACGTLRLLELLIPSGSSIPRHPVRQRWNLAGLNAALSVALLSVIFFYSGGFLDPSSLHGLVQTFSFWSHTGVEGAGHGKEWYYWFTLMGRYEWPILLGVAFSLRAVWPGMNRLSRLLAIYGCGTLTAYSIVSYKTPWCIIAIIWPFFFLFGEAVDTVLRACKGRPHLRWAGILTNLGAVIAVGVSAVVSIRLNYFRPTDPKEPYVYVQTMNDLFKLTRPLEKLVKEDPSNYHLRGNLLLSEYHPIPWVLGDFTQVPPYPLNARPATMDAPFVVVEKARITEVESELTQAYFTDSFQLRDGLEPGKLYLDAEKFAPFFPGRTPEFQPSLR
jgi:uncharacterized protein (TIGR03663 family)